MRRIALVLLCFVAVTATTSAEQSAKDPKVMFSLSWDSDQARILHWDQDASLNSDDDFWWLLVGSTEEAWPGPLGNGLAVSTSRPSAQVYMWGAKQGPASGTMLDIFNGRTVRYGTSGVAFHADMGLDMGHGWKLALGYSQSRTHSAVQQSFRDYLQVEGTEWDQIFCPAGDSMCPHSSRYIDVTTVNLSRRYRSSEGTVSVRAHTMSVGMEKRVTPNPKLYFSFTAGVDLQLYRIKDTTRTRDYVYSVFMPEGIKDFHPGARENPAEYRDEVVGPDEWHPSSMDKLNVRPYLGLGFDWWATRHLGFNAHLRTYPLSVSRDYMAESAIGDYAVPLESDYITFSVGTAIGF